MGHKQNSLSFGFITNNYIKPDQGTVIYRLKNYQEDWFESALTDVISYTKIPPGNYVMEVYGTNNDGARSISPLRLNIFIQSPFWSRWYMYLIYLFLALSLIITIAREWHFRVKVKREILSKQYKNEAIESLHNEKIKFYTNISHEFRTPLTLIISPLYNLLQKFQKDPSVVNQLNVMIRNADRLQRLTNQIMDFRMVEVGKMKVQPVKTDIVDLVKRIYNCFGLQIIDKKINLIFKSEFKFYHLVTDADLIEKIVYNLIGNAIKFSNQNSQILVTISCRNLDQQSYEGITFKGEPFFGESLAIRVQDYGIGIMPENMSTIFDRFTTSDKKGEGTGIGLHMCQEYAQMNGANISVVSTPEKGSTFTLNVPVNQMQEYKKEKVIVESNFDLELLDNPIDDELFVARGKQDVVLLAEDDYELRLYLKNALSAKYKVLTAKNGNQAIEIATEIIPDIIIADIAMPGTDGIEVTRILKSGKSTRHIPIIVLTALSDEQYHLESIAQGADAFLAKPIDMVTLQAYLDNLLSKREIVMEELESLSEVQYANVNANKESFIEMAERVVNENLQNPEFDVAELAVKMDLSTSTIHRKIKQYSNQSASEFIRDIRLKNAVMLLKDSKYNMAEIGFFVGFNSTSYFIRSFKKKYGKTPKAFSKNP